MQSFIGITNKSGKRVDILKIACKQCNIYDGFVVRKGKPHRFGVLIFQFRKILAMYPA